MTNIARRYSLKTTNRIKATIDTNILVSGLMFSGNERQVLDLAVLGIFDAYLSPHIINELTGVLLRKFNHSEEQVNIKIAAIYRWAMIVEPTETVSIIIRKPSDNRILECCLACNADYLITGDRRDLLPLSSFRGTVIVNAATFLGIFGNLSG